jgi:cardiolipin synthase
MISLIKIFKNYFPPYERRLTVPTFLTGIRFVLTPCIAVSIFYEYWAFCLLLFCLSAISDLLDGFIARRYNQKTKLGACLDPLADKFLIITTFLMLALKKNPYFPIPLWFVAIVSIKDFLLVVGSLFIFSINNEVSVKPSVLGKVTMALQVAALIWFLGASWLGYGSLLINRVVMGVVIFFGIASLMHYVYNGWVILNHSSKK